MSQYHKHAAEIVIRAHNDSNLSFELLTRILKDRPSAIVRAYRALSPQPSNPVAKTQNELTRVIAKECFDRNPSQTIRAIKELRARTTLSLKEAKDMIDEVRAEHDIR